MLNIERCVDIDTSVEQLEQNMAALEEQLDSVLEWLPSTGEQEGSVHQRRFATMSVLVALLAASLTAVALAGQTAAPSTPNSPRAWTP